MEEQRTKNENLTAIFVSVIALLLFGLLLYSSKSIVSPIFIYVLILIFYLLNRNEKIVKNIFILSTIIFLVWFFYELLTILTPFIIAFLIAYLLNPVVTILERKIPRWASTLIAILILILLGGLIISFIIPPFIEQVSLLISSAPTKINELSNFFNNKVLPELNRLGVIYPEIQKFITTELPAKLQSLLNGILSGILSLISGVSVVFNQIINLVIIPIMTFYFLKDFNKILETIRNLFSENYHMRINVFARRVDKIFGNYIRGFLTVSLINGTIITIGLTLIGVPYAVVLGLLSALLNFIPYFGVIISFSIGFLISLLSGISGFKLLLIPIIYFGENIIENSFISPKIIGERVGLHPLLVLFAIFVFGYFGGIPGMLISVPITALIISFFTEKDF